MIALPKNMSESQVRSLLIARRRMLTNQLIESKAQLRALVGRIDRLEAELAEIDDGEQILDN